MATAARKKLIIEARVNEYMMRDANPNVPWTPDEIARAAAEAREAGASIVNYHARNADGSPCHDAAAAIEMGGHVAIGLGDDPYTELGAPTNADVVHEVARLARAVGREVATPADTREMLGMG